MKAKIKTYNETKKMRQSLKEKIENELIKNSDGLSVYNLQARFGKKESTILARISELMDEGKVMVIGTFNNGRNSVFGFVYDNEQRVELQKKRVIEKYNRWLKNGIDWNWTKWLLKDFFKKGLSIDDYLEALKSKDYETK